MNRDVARVPLHNIDILTIKVGSEIYVAMKDICDGIGLQWNKQREKILANPVLGPAHHLRVVQVPGDIQQREIFTLPIQYLNGWLMMINPNKVKESIEHPYIASDYITSRITGQIVYCWIFGTKKPPFPEARSLTNLQ